MASDLFLDPGESVKYKGYRHLSNYGAHWTEHYLNTNIAFTVAISRAVLGNVLETDPTLKQGEWSYRLAIDLTGSYDMPKGNMPKNFVLFEPNGCKVMPGVIAFRGGYVYPFEVRAPKSDLASQKRYVDEVMFTGTLPTLRGLHTLFEDMLPCVGSRGFKNFQETKAWKEFYQRKMDRGDKTLSTMGFSMGGVPAGLLGGKLAKEGWEIPQIMMVNTPRFPNVCLVEGKNIRKIKAVKSANDPTPCGGGKGRIYAETKHRIYILGGSKEPHQKPLSVANLKAIAPDPTEKGFFATVRQLARLAPNHTCARHWRTDMIKLSDKQGDWAQIRGNTIDTGQVPVIGNFFFPNKDDEKQPPWEVFRSSFIWLITFLYRSTVGIWPALFNEITTDACSLRDAAEKAMLAVRL